MTKTEPLDLDAIEARATAAIPAPWCVDEIPETGECRIIWNGDADEDPPTLWPITNGGSVVADAEFIAAAREDVPALIAEVRRLREAMTEAVAECNPSSSYSKADIAEILTDALGATQ